MSLTRQLNTRLQRPKAPPVSAVDRRAEPLVPADVTVCIPHLDTPELLELCIALVRCQTVRCRILVVDTGSRPERLERLLKLRAADVEIQQLMIHDAPCRAWPVACALDLGLSLCRTEWLLCLHSDCLLANRELLAEWMVLAIGAEDDMGFRPPVGYQTYPRDGDWWRGMVSHTCTLLHVPTMDATRAQWNLRGLPQSDDPAYRDTEVAFNERLRESHLKPVFVGDETINSFETDRNRTHLRSYTIAVLKNVKPQRYQDLAPYFAHALFLAREHGHPVSARAERCLVAGRDFYTASAPKSQGGLRPAWVPVRENPEWLQVSEAELRRTLAVIPVYGQHELTHAIVRQCEEQGVATTIVDNGGDYEPVAQERVLRPGENLGWLRGNNLAIQEAGKEFERFVLLNNDLILSPQFFAGLIAAERDTGCDMVAASYDGSWKIQQPEVLGPAGEYVAQRTHLPSGACDGACVSVHRRVIESAGLMDAEKFGQYGWWAMTDWCIRAKQAGFTVSVTRAAYCNHLGQKTAQVVHGETYRERGIAEAVSGRAKKYGELWRAFQDVLCLRPVTVYTAITGRRDSLKDPPEAFRLPGMKWVCFTDEPQALVSDVWEVRPLPASLTHSDPRRRYKPLKCCPHRFGIEGDSIWLDASFYVQGDLRDLLWYAQDLGVFDRASGSGVDCVYEEARLCREYDLEDADVLERVSKELRAASYPEHAGLGWTGCIVRRDTPEVRAFGERWLAAIEQGSKRDQLSMMPVLRDMGLDWHWLPGRIRRNSWIMQERNRAPRPGLQDGRGR